MNGRIFDPVLGRFLSADPNIDGVSDSQGYNRYSYVHNNPLNATDPSGYLSLKEVGMIVAVVVAAVVTAGVAVYGAAVLAGQAVTLGNAFAALAGVGGWSLTGYGAIVAGAGAGFASGFAGSLLNGGSIGDAFKAGVIGGVIGGISGGIAHGIGDLAGKGGWNWAERALAHGATQGLVTEAAGGEFRHGFYAGAFTSALSGPIGQVGEQYGAVGEIVAAAVVGGTASAIGGGKFANGAVSRAFTYLLNDAQHPDEVEVYYEAYAFKEGAGSHGYLKYVDKKTGQVWVGRGGPVPDYPDGEGFGNVIANRGFDDIKLEGFKMRPWEQSSEQRKVEVEKLKVVYSKRIAVIKGSMDAVTARYNEYAAKVTEMKLTYRPLTLNSNTFGQAAAINLYGADPLGLPTQHGVTIMSLEKLGVPPAVLDRMMPSVF